MLISNPKIEIAFIVPRNDTKDDTLLNYSLNHSIDYLHPVDINSEFFIEKARTYKCDLFVSMSFNQIFKEYITNLPRLKTINCHAGKLHFIEVEIFSIGCSSMMKMNLELLFTILTLV